MIEGLSKRVPSRGMREAAQLVREMPCLKATMKASRYHEQQEDGSNFQT
jgi:hypothetical protein